MECAELAANLTDFLDGLLDAAGEAAALEHLATCKHCELVLTQTRAVVDLAHRHGRVELAAEERAQLWRYIVSEGTGVE